MITKTLLILTTTITLIGGIGYWYLTRCQEGFEGTLQLEGRKLVIFDFDGTLCDSFEEAINIFNAISQDYNLTPITESEREHYRSIPTQEFLKMHGVTSWKLPIVLYKMKKSLKNKIQNLKSFAGMKELIQKLQSHNIRVGILTSNSLDNVQAFLENNHYEGVDFIYYGSSLFGKDRLLNNIRSQSTINDIIYIGDEVRDIEACQKTSMPVIAVTWGYHSKTFLAKHSPNHIAEKAEAISSIVIENN